MFSRRTLYKYCSSELILRIIRRYYQEKRIAVLMYHEVLDDSAPINAWTVVKKSHFIRQMEYLQSNFRVVSLDEAFQSIYQQSMQTDKNIAVITFDDGYSGNKNVVFPIIESMAIPITIFVSTGTVQSRALNWYDLVIIALQHNSQTEINLERF